MWKGKGIWLVLDFHRLVALLMVLATSLQGSEITPRAFTFWSLITGNKRRLWTDRLPWPCQHQLTAEATNTLTPNSIEVFHNRSVIHSISKIITCVFHLSVFFPHTCCHQPCFLCVGWWLHIYTSPRTVTPLGFHTWVSTKFSASHPQLLKEHTQLGKQYPPPISEEIPFVTELC